MKNLLLIFVISICGLSTAKAQYLEYGLGIGGSVYWGDLNSPDFSSNLSNTHVSVQAMAKLNFSKYIALKGNLLYGKLSGDDSKSFLAWQKQRNLNFTTTLIEFAVLGEYHLFGYNFGEENPISPYFTAGLSAFYFNPTTELNGVSYALQPLGTEGQGMPGFASKYNRLSLAIPFGAGAKFKVNDQVNFSIDILARRTFTDYIDDVSTDYVAYEELAAGNGPIAASLGNRIGEFFGQDQPVNVATGQQRGGANVKDYFFTGMVTITFKLNKNVRLFGSHRHRTDCPKF
ncbi:MAG: DUF6089 family protein [Saprospiraceae bacterium]|nr:DUF6089 family protein [Saprospiraceae bacterium]